MAEVYSLTDPVSRARLIERLQEPTNGNTKKKRGRPFSQHYVERKLFDARGRGLFNTLIDFTTITHRILVTDAPCAARVYLSDPIFAQTRIFPECDVHQEWFLNAHIYRTPVLILSDIEDLVFQLVTDGLNSLPTGKHVQVALLFASEFSTLDALIEFLVLIGKRKEPRLRAQAKLIKIAGAVLRDTLLDDEDHAEETSLYLYDHKLTNDPHNVWRLLSGELRLSCFARCRLSTRKGLRNAYMLMPERVYEYATRERQLVEVYDFDLVTDPVQWDPAESLATA